MLSYWEKKSLLEYDVIIVGSGIVGLSTAISLKEKDESLRILVMERGILPTGASTKNAGFACVGSLTEILDDLQQMTETEMLQLVEMRFKGLRKLRERLGDKNIDYAENGSYELINIEEEKSLSFIDKVNGLLRDIFHEDAFELQDQHISSLGFDKTYTKHLIKNNFEGELDTGKMMWQLIRRTIAAGVEIKTGCEVLRIEESANHVGVVVNHNLLNSEVCFTCKQVVLCTNAFAKKFVAELEIYPGRGQVLITRQIPDLKVKGIFHFNKGYYYFRALDGRILFGGGRNLDFEGEQTNTFGFNQKIQSDLKEKLETIILPGVSFEIEDWWTGIMAFGENKFPIVCQHSDRIFIGARMGGMGVAIGSQVAHELAELVYTK